MKRLDAASLAKAAGYFRVKAGAGPEFDALWIAERIRKEEESIGTERLRKERIAASRAWKASPEGQKSAKKEKEAAKLLLVDKQKAKSGKKWGRSSRRRRYCTGCGRRAKKKESICRSCGSWIARKAKVPKSKNAVRRKGSHPKRVPAEIRRLEYAAYLRSSEWKTIRGVIVERDGGLCRDCRGPGRQVHHLTYRRIFREIPEDLILLCERCHVARENEKREKRGLPLLPCVVRPAGPVLA